MVRQIKRLLLSLVLLSSASAMASGAVRDLVDESLMVQSAVSGASIGQLLEAFKKDDLIKIYWDEPELRDEKINAAGPAWAGDLMTAIFSERGIEVINLGDKHFYVFKGMPPYIPGVTSKNARPEGVHGFVAAPGPLSNLIRTLALEYELSPITEIDLSGWAISEPVRFKGDNLIADIKILERILSSVFESGVTVEHYVAQSMLLVKDSNSDTASVTDPAVRGCYNAIDFNEDISSVREGIAICNGGAIKVY